jgi:hypothetical protein
LKHINPNLIEEKGTKEGKKKEKYHSGDWGPQQG